MKKFALSLLGLWKQLGINQRVSLIVASLAVIGGMVAIVVWSRRPDFQLLYSQLGGKDAGAIVAYLDAQGVPYQVTAGGSAFGGSPIAGASRVTAACRSVAATRSRARRDW